MCGIIGIYNREGIDKKKIEKATKMLEHRGPDNYGFFFDNYIGLGHRRLSVIDLSEKGKQPMTNEQGDMWIVYNGEIYNFQELREELEKKGHKFRSNTDSEVVLHAYEQYGASCLQQFNGMFAFAIFDSKRKQLFLARDRAGVKPLYYYYDKNKFIFASEIKAILEFGVKKSINEKILYDYFNYFILVGEETLFEGIKSLSPGHYLVLSFKNNSIEKRKWFDICYSSELVNENAAKKQVLELLEDSIKKRMISDVSLGVFLSGGLDSSTIVAIMRKIGIEKIKTFCVGSGDEIELGNAREVAELFKTEHNEILINEDDFIKALPEMIWHYDMPISFASSVPLYFISKMTKGKATVVLTGEGADELFAGYHRYARMMRAKKLDKLLRIFSFSSPLFKFHDPRYQKNIELLLKFKKSFLDYATGINIFIGKERENSLAVNKNSILKSKIQDILNEKQTCFLNKLLYLDFKTYLIELLMKQDKMSMAASIESRVPFLDYRIIELSARMDSNLKLRGNCGKYILKKTMQDFLPEKVIWQKKLGFPVPIDAWFRKELNSFISDNLLGGFPAMNYFDRNYVKKLIEKQKTKNCSLQLWAMINFKLWHDKFFI